MERCLLCGNKMLSTGVCSNIMCMSHNLQDYTDCNYSLYAYGGLSCEKAGIVKDGQRYLVKFPNKLKDKNMKNVILSYANDVLSEYIASKIMSLFLPTHEVSLGLYKGKVCAICKDFTQDGSRLFNYQELKNTSAVAVNRTDGTISNGADPDLDTVIEVLKTNPALSSISDVQQKFWTMFIVDALNGNPDRNNTNWGVVIKDDTVEFAPIYDNGNSLSSKLSDEQMADVVNDKSRLKAIAYSGFRCFFEVDESRVNPFHYIESGVNRDCINTLNNLDLNVSSKINCVIDSLHLTLWREQFYKLMYEMRLSELIKIQSMFK